MAFALFLTQQPLAINMWLCFVCLRSKSTHLNSRAYDLLVIIISVLVCCNLYIFKRAKETHSFHLGLIKEKSNCVAVICFFNSLLIFDHLSSFRNQEMFIGLKTTNEIEKGQSKFNYLFFYLFTVLKKHLYFSLKQRGLPIHNF